eukprot:m.307913 g.307913  ORF g.307913 m.307913 type:complete len:170 (+) comp43017_c0_seq1:61-570(+)
MRRGKGKRLKGMARHFTNEDEVRLQEEKRQKESDWRRRRGLDSDEEEEKEEKEERKSDAIASSDSETESSDDEEDSKQRKPKGLEGLIEVENPNRVVKKSKRAGDIDVNAKVELSRREREAIEKQKATSNYRQKHAAGKTEEARADLARLAVIRKQREEAAAAQKGKKS